MRKVPSQRVVKYGGKVARSVTERERWCFADVVSGYIYHDKNHDMSFRDAVGASLKRIQIFWFPLVHKDTSLQIQNHT